jgi:hypothetical protein
MATLEEIIQAVRAWHKLALGLTDAQIIPADDKGPRPTPPYLTVKVTTPGIDIGTAERLDGVDGGSPTLTIRQLRRAVVSVQGFGDDAIEWLDYAGLALDLPDVYDLLAAAGLTVDTLGEARNLSGFVDTEIEPRYLREYSITYKVATDPAVLVPCSQVQIDVTQESPNPGDLDVSITIDIS